MAKTTSSLLPAATELLQRFGERLRLARLRRRLTAKQVAERAGMTPMTLRSLERGGAGVTMGAYLAVMQVLGIEQDFSLLGAADLQGRALQDTRLTARGKSLVRAKQQLASAAPVQGKQTTAVAAVTTAAVTTRGEQTSENKPSSRTRKGTRRWVEKSGFTSAQSLVDLIDTNGSASKKRR